MKLLLCSISVCSCHCTAVVLVYHLMDYSLICVCRYLLIDGFYSFCHRSDVVGHLDVGFMLCTFLSMRSLDNSNDVVTTLAESVKVNGQQF